MKKAYLLMGFFCFASTFLFAEEYANIPKLSVKGEATIFKPADQLEISLGVLTAGSDSSIAARENNQNMQKVISNLKAIGLDDSDYQMGRFIIRPIYQKKDNESTGEIKHYESLNTVAIKTQKIDLSQKIIEAAVQGGANQIEGINFNLNNPQDYVAEAIKKAAQNAQSNAETLAAALGIKIKRVLNVSLEQWQQSTRPQPRLYQSVRNEDSEPVIHSGKTELHATVNAHFEI